MKHPDYSQAKTVDHFVTLVYVSAAQNSNKGYIIRYYTDGTAQGFNGRVDDAGRMVPQRLMSWAEADGKRREKLDKGYREVETVADTTGAVNKQTARPVSNQSFVDTLVTQVANGNRQLADLIRMLATRNQHNIAQAVSGSASYNVTTGQWSTPLGIIGPSAIAEARSFLASISNAVAANSYGGNFGYLVESYMTRVPMDVGRKRWEPRDVLGTPEQIAAQEALLDGLEASITAAQVVSAPTTKYRLTLAVADSPTLAEWQADYTNSSRGADHYTRNWKIRAAYKVDLEAMTAAYKAMPDGGVRLRLWHSTGVGNVLSILLNGFRVPKAQTNGWAFGPGIYFSNVGSKSTQYCGGGENFSFLCHVNMGRPFEMRTWGQSRTPSEVTSGRYNSTYAIGSLQEPNNRSHNGVKYNEMIVYETSRVMPVGLVHWN